MRTPAVQVLEIGIEERLLQHSGGAKAYAYPALRTAFFGGDDDGAVLPLCTVQRGGSRAFEYGDGSDIVRVEVADGVAVVEATVLGSSVSAAVVHDNAVNHEDGLVVARQGTAAADQDAAAPPRARTRWRDVQARYLAG